MLKAILFDFDGVLVESVDIKTQAFRDLFADEGPKVVEQVVSHHLRHGGVSRLEKIRHAYRQILQRPLSEERFRELAAHFSRLVVEKVVAAPYVEGAREFLQSSPKDYDYFVVSGTPQEELDAIVDRRGMRRFFEGVYGSPRKKAVAISHILAAHAWQPEDALMIGDALTDYEAACECGVLFLARCTSNDPFFAEKTCHRVENLVGLSRKIGEICLELRNL